MIYATFGMATLANFLFFRNFDFGYVVLPHEVGIFQILTFSILVVLLTISFFLSTQTALNNFISWGFVLSGASFLRYTISDDILFIAFAFFLIFFKYNSFYKFREMKEFSFLGLFFTCLFFMSVAGMYYSLVAVRFCLLFFAAFIIATYFCRISEKQILKAVEQGYWPCVFFVFMTYLWWVGIYIWTAPQFAVPVGSLEGIGYAGASHKEAPLILLSISSLIKYCWTKRVSYLVLATLIVGSFVVMADSRFATLIFAAHAASILFLSKRAFFRVFTPLFIAVLVILFSVVGDLSYFTNYIGSMVATLNSSTEMISYGYRDQTIHTQTGDIGRLLLLKAALYFTIFSFPESLFGCGFYRFYECASIYLDQLGFVPYHSFDSSWNSQGLARAPFLPSLIVETGILGSLLLIPIFMYPILQLRFSIQGEMFVLIQLAVFFAFFAAGYVTDIPILFFIIVSLGRIANHLLLRQRQ